MGHITLKMIFAAIASLSVFSLAQAENRAEKQREEQEKESKEEKKKKADERFKAQQNINRALRDQGMQHGPVTPPLPPQTK